QKITDNVDLLVRANYAWNSSYNVSAPIAANISVSADNPWRQELTGGANGFTVQPTPVVNGVLGAVATYPIPQIDFPNGQNGKNDENNANLLTNTAATALSTQTVMTNFRAAFGPNSNYSYTTSKNYGANAEIDWRIDG